jgi:uncharacterized protein involved in outer membrane biogenesis
VKRRLAATLALLAVLLVAGAFAAVVLGPPLLNWNRYRDTIAAAASERLGRPVTIAGPISLALWPEPVLTAEQVDVGGTSGIRVASLRLRVGLGPLLAGRVEARQLVLRGLDLVLPWPPPQAVLASRPPHWVGAFAASIEGGTIHLGELALTDIQATVTQAPDGLLAAAGTAHLGARAGRFNVRLGTPGGDGAAGLDVALEGLDTLAGTGAAFTGAVARDGSLDGHVVARGTDLALLIGAPSLPFRAEGRLTLGDGLAAMDEATFDIGGAPASGAMALRITPLTRLDIALSATRLDLDPWLAALLPATGKALMQVRMPLGVDLAVEAARLGGGTVERLRARADLDHGDVVLSGVSGILPGEAQVRLNGTIDAVADAPRLTGAIQLDAPALRTTLRWLNESGMARVPLPPGPVLRSATIKASLNATTGHFALDALTGRIDGAAVAGRVRLDGGAHPGFAVDVATDRLALDPWLPDGEADAATPRRWLAPGRIAALFGGADAQVTVRAEHATLRGMPIEGLELDAAATPAGQLTLHQLGGAALGLRLSAAGTLAADGQLAGARLSLTGPSAAPLAALAPEGFATPDLWRVPLALSVQADGPPAALALGIALDLGHARLEAQPLVNLDTGGWRMTASLRHPDAMLLLARLGVLAPQAAPGAADWPGEGSLSLMGQFSRAGADADHAGRLSADSFDITAGTLRAHGQLTLDGRRIDGAVTADILPVPLPDPTGQAPLPLAKLRGWTGTVHVQAAQIVAADSLDLLDQAAMTVMLSGDTLTLDGLTARLDGGTLSGSATLNIGAAPPALTVAATLQGAVIAPSADDMPVGLLSGRLDGTLALTAGGYSPAAMLATLSGSLHATAHDGALAGFDLFRAARAIGAAPGQPPDATEQSLRAALQGGATSFDRLDLSGDVAHGLLTLTSAQLQGPAGAAQAQGSIGLTDGAMDIHVALSPSVPGAPTVGLRLGGLVTAPSHQPELAAAERWLAELPHPQPETEKN